MDDLVAFLRAALDRDEQVAIAAIRDHSDPSGRWALGGDSDNDVRPADPTGNDWVAVGPWGGGLGDATAGHIARFDPKRMLDEVQAKRQVLDLHDRDHECSTYSSYEPGEIDNCTWVLKDDGGCLTIRLLAQPCAGQPGWREEWQLSAPA